VQALVFRAVFVYLNYLPEMSLSFAVFKFQETSHVLVQLTAVRIL